MNDRTNKTGISEKTSVSFASFVGVDLHKCTVTLVAVDAHGKVIAKLTISTKCIDKIQDWLQALPRPSWMAVEAVCFVEWFIDRYRTCVHRIDIADATELSNRRGKRRKTDRNDALAIAVRLARGDCPLGFIAEEPLMQLRKLGRHWRQLSLSLSRTKHYIRSILLAANIRGPKLDGASAQRWFLAHGGLLKDVQRQAFTNFTDIILLIERQRESLRRVIIMAEHNSQGSNPRFVVTNLSGDPQGLYDDLYCQRGDMENRIKEQQLDLFAGRTSCHDFLANQFRLLLSSAAYVLIESLRRLGLTGTELAKAQAGTIRLKLLKIGARISCSVRRIVLHLAGGYPLKELFARVLSHLRNPLAVPT